MHYLITEEMMDKLAEMYLEENGYLAFLGEDTAYTELLKALGIKDVDLIDEIDTYAGAVQGDGFKAGFKKAFEIMTEVQNDE